MVSKAQGAVAIDASKHDVDVPSVRDNNPKPSTEDKMKVVVRVRPLQAKEESWPHAADTDERGPDVPATITIQENQVMWEKNGQLKTLKADAVFANGATQDNVYRSVSECVDALIAGFDCSVFAYGQTGTGKTYTMSGFQRDESADFSSIGPSHGVVPRSIERLFIEMEREKRAAGGASFSVYCSFIEIYNEKIFDILSPETSANGKGNQPPSPTAKAAMTNGSLTQRARWNSTLTAKDSKSLQIRQKLDGSVFVDGMTSRNVGSQAELLQAFREGSLHREVRDNFYNQFSSRGHAVFQITLRRTLAEDDASKPNSKKTRLSRLFFVDLAGSEKWHVNGSDLTDKYACELAAINKSLSALTNCVMALTQDRSHVPFRDSVLTRLLQTCLQGSGRTAFIVTISPSKGSLEESFATLRFAERLKAIRCRPIRRSLFSNEMLGEQRLYYERQIQTMRAEVNRLRELLRKANQRPSDVAEYLSKDANAALVEENRRLKELLLQSERSRLVERNERINTKSGKSRVTGGAAVKMSPQQFSARQILKPFSVQDGEPNVSLSARNLHQDSQMKNSTKDIVGSAPTDSRSGSDQRRDELSTLETQLQSKEARLNWMLEAEMEAQNGGSGVTRPSADKAETMPSDPNRRSTVARSWAVETRLRRQLVGVPPPLRAPQLESGSKTKSSGVETDTASQREPEPAKRVLPALAVTPTSSSRPDPVARLEPALNIPSRRRAPSPPTASYRHNDQAAAGSRRNRADAFARSHPVSRSEPEVQQEQVKASSILKLVGSSGDTLGKSREELIEDYKRARRVELEAMMRTMVQK